MCNRPNYISYNFAICQVNYRTQSEYDLLQCRNIEETNSHYYQCVRCKYKRLKSLRRLVSEDQKSYAGRQL